MLSAVFLSRIDNTTPLTPLGARVEVTRLRSVAQGGYDSADITVTGGSLDVWQASNYLRCPVEIYDEIGRMVWVGMVNAVSVQDGVYSWTASLDSMANRVAVRYMSIAVNSTDQGISTLTAYADDATAQAEYGVKEKIFSAGSKGLAAATATAKQTAILAMTKYPQAGAEPSGSRSQVGTATATLTCVGWWKTVNWKYAAVGIVNSINYYPTGTIITWGIGNLAASTSVAQSFTVAGADLKASTVTLQVKKVGAPADNFVVALQADAAGVPSGTDLATSTLAGTSLTTGIQTLTFTLSAAIQLPASSLMWIVARRSTGLDAANYYMWNVETSGAYSGGAAALYDGSAWGIPATYDAYFAINVDNNVDSIRQIANLAANYGQFISGADLEAVGIETPSYVPENELLAWDAIAELLDVGGSNNRRLLAEVNQSRRLRVWEEDADTVINYYMDRNGDLFTLAGEKIQPYLWPVGVWVQLRDATAATANTYSINNVNTGFIEAVEWSGGAVSPVFRGMPDPEKVFEGL